MRKVLCSSIPMNGNRVKAVYTRHFSKRTSIMKKTVATMALCITILLMNSLPLVLESRALAATPGTSACIDKVSSQANPLGAGLDQQKAISMAENSPSLQAMTRGYSYHFDSIFDNWSWDSGCNVTWTKVNVASSM